MFLKSILRAMWLDPLDFPLAAHCTSYSKLTWQVAGPDPQLPLKAQNLNIAIQQVKC